MFKYIEFADTAAFEAWQAIETFRIDSMTPIAVGNNIRLVVVYYEN